MTPEQKEKFKKEKIESFNRGIAEIEQQIADLESKYQKELKELKDRLDIAKFQKEIFVK